MPGRKIVEEKPPPVQFDASTLVTIIGADESEFIVDRQCAMMSKYIKTQLEELKEDEEPIIRLPDIQAHTLERAVQYFYYKFRYDSDPDERTDFEVPPSIALDLMVVASHLGC